ncbi:NAD(P)/FAD-dependent oxidoreductase [Paracoccus saliphilus]|uniref:FAD-binding oxidoreductase n=1 Tax=Paracoccus saliphilus TaxID=405559 RepID=A0AA45W8F7_9RHOB|nr:FAD-dependent oxidoreductase [Paracoccus saliphilus]WCR02961.1 FAD-binding oxidoreductase [Paracoccus saliphilus]SIT16486.1 Glycine/D-amino acid oxidase [Paracoccus saliphilus]
MTLTADGMKTTPYWWDAAPPQPLPEKPIEKSVDVAIVGAGYAGLTAGLTLVRAGRSVAVFDRQHPGEGASSRNGGITSGSIRPDHQTLLRKFGEARTMAIEREGKLAREHLYSFLKEEGIECDFQLSGRFGGAIGPQDYEQMSRNAEKLRRDLGIEAYAVPQAEQHDYIGTDFFRGGVVRMDIGGLHPAKFISELLRVAQAAGVVIHSDTAATNIDRDGREFIVRTSRGHVRARQVLVCTNGYTDEANPWLRRRLVPVRSRIIATEELSTELMARLMPRQMMLGDTRTLGFYFRPSPDGKRILFGGRDGTYNDDPSKPVAYLHGNLLEIFPELQGTRISHTWFGNVAMHRDMIPRIFTRDEIVYATGFCGSGVVWAPWIGRWAALKLLGKEQDNPSAFDFRAPASIPFYRGKPWFMPLFMALYKARDRKKMRREGRI